MSPQGRVSAEQRAVIVARYVDGASIREVAAGSGCSYDATRRVLWAAGVMRSRTAQRRVSEQRRAMIVAAYRAGRTIDEVAAAANLSVTTVSTVLRAAGVVRPPGRRVEEMGRAVPEAALLAGGGAGTRYAVVRRGDGRCAVIAEQALAIHRAAGWYRVSEWTVWSAVLHGRPYPDGPDLDAPPARATGVLAGVGV